MSKKKLDHVTQPGRIGKLETKNRMVRMGAQPMPNVKSENGISLMFEHYVLSHKVLTDMLLMDVPAFMLDNVVKTVVFHGDADPLIPAFLSEETCARCSNMGFELRPGMGHGLTLADDLAFEAAGTLDNLSRFVQAICCE